MEYKELMHLLNRSEFSFLRHEESIFNQNPVHDTVLPTTNGEIRCVMYDLPRPIGRDLKCFTMAGEEIVVDISKPVEEMNFMEYVKLLCKAKIIFYFDFESFEGLDGGKVKMILVFYPYYATCECGCITESGSIELPTIMYFNRDTQEQLIEPFSNMKRHGI